MKHSGCRTCPEVFCDCVYRGSICKARRAEYGLGDPMTISDKIRAMDDEEMAEFLATKLPDDICDWADLMLKWLQRPVNEL